MKATVNYPFVVSIVLSGHLRLLTLGLLTLRVYSYRRFAESMNSCVSVLEQCRENLSISNWTMFVYFEIQWKRMGIDCYNCD